MLRIISQGQPLNQFHDNSHCGTCSIMHAKLYAVQLVKSFVDSMQAYRDDYVELTIKRIHSHSICLCAQKNLDTSVPEPLHPNLS